MGRKDFFNHLACVCVLTLITGNTWAAEWAMSSRIRAEHVNNDNFQMTTLPQNDVSITTVNPVVGFSWETERTNINLEGDWKRKMYSGNESLKDNTDETYTLTTGHKTESNQFSLAGSWIKDTTLSQEGYNELLGLVFDQIDRTTWNVAPAWTWRVDEKSSIKLDYLYQEGEYDNNTGTQLFDYGYDKVGGSYFYQLTEKTLAYIQLGYSTYESVEKGLLPLSGFSVTQSELLKAKNETNSAQLGFEHQFSTTFKMGLGYGVSTTDSTNVYQVCTGSINFLGSLICTSTGNTISSLSSSSPVYSVTAEKKFELTKINFDASQTISASGLGSEMITESIGLNINREITSLLRLNLDLNYTDREASNEAFRNNDRTTYSGEFKFNWRAGRQWWLEGRYRYTQVENKTSALDPESNTVAINFRYNWDKTSISR
ncbi:MAG: outer membrane beta-barrel protein [Gammaproteobacteria bacterium]|nr:outer membrane beta-barrel protein [Gammaproteobacteria bacterium]